MNRIVLTGFMGTGKSTVGRILADRLGLPFIDTDAEVERRAGRPVPDLIREAGEPAFREMERAVLRDVAAGRDQVVATGGGALLDSGNRALFDGNAALFCLACEPAELLGRLGNGQDRPVLGTPTAERIQALFEERRPVYDLLPQVDTGGRTPEAVAGEIIARLPPLVLRFERGSRSDITVLRGSAAGVGETLRQDGVTGTVLLVTDQNVAAAGHAGTVQTGLEAVGFSTSVAALPPGETTKSTDCLALLYESALASSLERSDTVVGVGGGVVCDLAGMLAATYMRGVRLVLVPTSLLAQVDAAVGGKVGIDLGAAKNVVGAFHPAERVFVDPAVLATLDSAELRQGLAEIVKIAMILSPHLWEQVSKLNSAAEVPARDDLIRNAVQVKVDLVQTDPYERGDRALLNFGHTVGHAVEAASGYRLSHGEAVAVGMAAELHLAVAEGFSPACLMARLTATLERFGLPSHDSNVSAEEVARLMRHDKKRRAGGVRMAVPVALGTGRVVEVSDEQALAAASFAAGSRP